MNLYDLISNTAPMSSLTAQLIAQLYLDTLSKNLKPCSFTTFRTDDFLKIIKNNQWNADFIVNQMQRILNIKQQWATLNQPVILLCLFLIIKAYYENYTETAKQSIGLLVTKIYAYKGQKYFPFCNTQIMQQASQKLKATAFASGSPDRIIHLVTESMFRLFKDQYENYLQNPSNYLTFAVLVWSRVNQSLKYLAEKYYDLLNTSEYKEKLLDIQTKILNKLDDVVKSKNEVNKYFDKKIISTNVVNLLNIVYMTDIEDESEIETIIDDIIEYYKSDDSVKNSIQKLVTYLIGQQLNVIAKLSFNDINFIKKFIAQNLYRSSIKTTIRQIAYDIYGPEQLQSETLSLLTIIILVMFTMFIIKVIHELNINIENEVIVAEVDDNKVTFEDIND